MNNKKCTIILRSLALFYILFLGTGLAPGEMRVSGVGSGEFLLNFTIQDTAPVYSGSYVYDLLGIHFPPIEGFSVKPHTSNYSYTLPGLYIPGKPNNFTVSASKVKNLNIGVKKDQGSYENSSMVFKPEYTRIWVTSLTDADNNGTATITNSMLSPGSYEIKIFGDAAENISKVNLTMTLVKKLIVNGRFNVSVNTTGFPSGKYEMSAKAINGSVRLDEIGLANFSF